MENLLVLNIEEKKYLLSKRGFKTRMIEFYCSQCHKKSITKLKYLTDDFLCKKCKISNTKSNISQDEKNKIIEKSKQTCLEKYGVTNVTYLPDHNQKTKETLMQKYGVSNSAYLQNDPTYTPLKERRVEEKFFSKNELQNHFKEVENYQTKWGEWTDKDREIISEKRFQTRWKKYGTFQFKHNFKFDNQQFDSSWELAVWIWAKDHNKEIEREPQILRYEFEGKKHKYIPDFRIDGKLIEVKGRQFFRNGDISKEMINPFNRTQDKLFEAKHQCGLQNGVQFWSEKEIFPILDYIDEKYGKDYLNQFLMKKKAEN